MQNKLNNKLSEKLNIFLSAMNERIQYSSSDIESNLDVFFRDLKIKLGAYFKEKEASDLKLASDFNLFYVIKQDEIRLSNIIRELLDPKGKHGQGIVFLENFLCMLNIPQKFDLSEAKAYREDPTSDGKYLDILIDLGKFGIGIENKPWADDSSSQISSYVDHLKKLYGTNFKMIYLSGNGIGPQEYSIRRTDWESLLKNKQGMLLAYKTDFKRWLEYCFNKCRANKVKWFLEDFIDYVDKCFSIIKEVD